MKQNIIVAESYSNPAVETYLSTLEAELQEFALVQGKEDAETATEITEPEFITKAQEPIKHRIQLAIDHLRKEVLPTSKILDAKEIDQAAEQDSAILSNEANDLTLKKQILVRKRNGIPIDPFKKKYGPYLMPLAIIVGLGDGILAYSGFKGIYPFFMAIGAALSIAAVISLSHFAYSAWIHNSKTPAGRNLRIAFVLAIALAFFAWVGNLRADAVNNAININVSNSTISGAHAYHINGWAIAIISFVLFAAILAFSLLLWKNKKERQDEKEFKDLSNEIKKIEAEQIILASKKKQIKDHAAKQKSDARVIFDYVTICLRKCKNIGRAAIAHYKQTYARFHRGGVPAFFTNTDDPSYDDSFHLITPETTKQS